MQPLSPSPPPGAERAGVRWGIPEQLPAPTSPSQRSALGPSLSPPEGRRGVISEFLARAAPGQFGQPLLRRQAGGHRLLGIFVAQFVEAEMAALDDLQS